MSEEKFDSAQNYHPFLTSDKIFKTPFKYGYGWLVELECGHVLEFAMPTKKETELKRILCAQCRADSKTVQDETVFFKGILRYRRVKI